MAQLQSNVHLFDLLYFENFSYG